MTRSKRPQQSQYESIGILAKWVKNQSAVAHKRGDNLAHEHLESAIEHLELAQQAVTYSRPDNMQPDTSKPYPLDVKGHYHRVRLRVVPK